MAIGETILGAVLSVVLDKLASKQVIDFFKSSKLDQSLVDRLQQSMLVATKLLDDAEQKQITNKAVNSWLNDLKHLFYRAEEIVDEIATEALRSSMDLTPETYSFGTKVRTLIPAFTSSSSFINNVNSKISEVVTQLELRVKNSSALGLMEGSVSKKSGGVPTSYLVDDTEVFGREQEKKELLQLLISEEAERNKISVVAIVGMGGLGKTTLAKIVYNDDSLGSFDLKAWVYVSDQFDVSQVTKSILECITHQSYSGSLQLSVLQFKLSKTLREKRFLLVLDDVWNEKDEEWECLRAPLTVGASGSKVIVTTRNDGVASVMDTSSLIHLQPLSDEDGLSLFSKHAFGVENLSPNPRAEGIGRDIVQKCKGLPLAIKTLGRLLRTKEDIKEWETILKSSVWDLPANKSNIVPALRLSYYHLPSHLKRCFSYCAIFPKGHRFDRDRLVLLWMAENFVKPIEGKRIEDIGEEYLCQLLSCSFFERTDDPFELLMHDLMHDLAQDISVDFVTRLENRETTPKISEKTRHFSSFRDNFDVFTKFEHLHATKFLRTFYLLPWWTLECHWPSISVINDCYLSDKICVEVIPQFYCLRVLSLTEYKILKLPETIENLKQLRFLDVSNTGIKELPESVCTLYHLQTLLLSQCKNLELLPANMSRLVSLRHLDLSGTSLLRQMPQQMSKLSSLQTLTDFVVSQHGGASIKELRKLWQIRGKLALRSLQNVYSPDDALDANLSGREYLDKLALEFDDKDSDDSEKCRAVLENLKPPVNLEELTIGNYPGTRFPSWLDTECWMYSKIVYLSLIGCQYCFSLPPLGGLPCLRDLDIMGMDYIMVIGSEFYGYDSGLSNPFPVLCSLAFREMKCWEMWAGHQMEGRGLPFPCLERISLDNCPELKGDLPVHLPSLKKLHVEGCDRLPNSFLQPPSIHCSPLSASSLHLALLTSLNLHNLVRLVILPPEICTLSYLEIISIHNCCNLVALNNIQLPPNIRCLDIKECKVVRSLPEAMFRLTHLRELKIISCPCLSSDDKDTLPTSLEYLKLESCKRWEFVLFEVPNTGNMQQQHYIFLVFITIENIGKTLVSFPLGAFPKLQHLDLHHCRELEVVYIPRGMDLINLTSLESLTILDSPKLKYIGKTEEGGIVDLPAPNLRHLLIRSCDIVKPLNGNREGLPSKLESLDIDGFHKITLQRNARSLLMFSCLRVLIINHHFAECFPDKDTLPDSIAILWLWDFPNLKLLNGEALKSLSSIQELLVWECRNLERLPEEELPPSLGYLDLWECPLLEERCERYRGLDWHKIRHLPCVKINNILI